MRTIYQILKLLYDWELPNMNRVEKRFVKDMWEASKGVGDNPTDESLIEQCGLSPARVKWIKDLGKEFLIK